MDKAILESLQSAFEVAPSADLAKVILLDGQIIDPDHLEKYMDHLDIENLSNNELSFLAEHLMENDAISQLITVLDVSDPMHKLLLVKAKITNNEIAEARNLYLQLIEEYPEHVEEGLNKQLDVDSDALTQENTNKPKLRVVEKHDVAEITQLEKYRQKTTDFNDVVGLSEIKKLIHKKIILPFQKPSLFQRFKKKIGGGVLLYGPPGCGKTLLARATAGECNASFYNIEISDVLDMYIGESEQKLHAIFEKARADTPCVLFFDELEALAGKREYNKGNSSNIVSQFLTELDGYSQNNDGVLVLASTNVPWSIDSAFLRPGRFDRMFFVPPPDKEAREAIVQHYLKEKPTEGKIDFATLAAKTGGFSGADIENLIDMATDEAIDESLESGVETNISYAHLKAALRDCRATTIEWLTTARNYARYANDGGRYDDVLRFLKKNGK